MKSEIHLIEIEHIQDDAYLPPNLRDEIAAAVLRPLGSVLRRRAAASTSERSEGGEGGVAR